MEESMEVDMIDNPEDLHESCPAGLTRRELVHRISKQPDDVFLLSSLANAYLEEGEYLKALEVSSKAHALAPTNPLVLWDHARALYMNERYADAVMLHRRILKNRVVTIAARMHWSRDKAKRFQNACRFDLALCYIQLDRLSLAATMLSSYVVRCRDGSFYYSPDLARAKLRCLTKLKVQARRHSMRLWISFLEIRKPSVGGRVKYTRGFTNGLVMARTHNDAIAKLHAGITELGYELVAAEDTEEFDRRCLKTQLPESTLSIAEQVRKDRSPHFTEFCMYRGRQ
jgi:tetratricopeptide (TPR) repeat protein